jgi:peptidoglycan hydrolase-like protein with peptidoglycan-binding domain
VGATGYYGEITTEAVRAFQRDRGLLVDGLAGPVTVNALLGYPTRSSASVAASPSPEVSVTYTPASTIDPASTTTQLGDVGAAVAAQKVRLNEFGYTAGTGDRFDDKMEFAVRRFQEDKGLKVTGKIGDRTNQILFAPENGLPPVEPGDANTLVQLVQERLGLLPTGAFDEDTQQAVKSFQAERGLPTTGVVSRQTHRELKTWLGRLAVVNEILGQPQL